MSLPTVGTISYNGVTFNEKVESHISGRPVYDQAGRTIIFIDYTLTVDAYVTPNDYSGGSTTDTDGDMVNLRRALLAPGGQLRYEDKGFGDLTINVSSTKDVLWGPKPELLDWFSVGSKAAAKIKWVCRFHIPECANASYALRLMEWNYSLSYSINRGLTTRTISGQIRIPQTRATQSTRTLSDTPDRYWESIIPAIPIGFRRNTMDRNISPDKSSMQFTFVDEEVASQNALPTYVTDCDVTHALATVGKYIFARFSWSISGSITMAPGYPTSAAWGKFLVILHDRLRYVRRTLLASGAAIFMAPTGFNWEEDVFGLTSRFSASYELVVPPKGKAFMAREAVAGSGLWKPLDGTNWASWNQSMVIGRAHNPRGRADLFHSAADDAIIDLCGTANAEYDGNGRPRGQIVSRVVSVGMAEHGAGLYLWWENWVTLQEENSRIYHVPLGRNAKIIEQVRHSPQYLILMRGYAMRLSLPSPVPELKRVNGFVVKRVGSPMVSTRTIGYYGGYPVIVTSWSISYRMEKASKSTKIDPPMFPVDAGNPMMGLPPPPEVQMDREIDIESNSGPRGEKPPDVGLKPSDLNINIR